MKAISLTFQRNGVAGESFYQFVYKHKEQGMRNQLTFVATFDTKKECTPDEYIDWKTCRVTSIDEPSLCWRGDRIAADIQNYLYDTFGKPEGTPEDYFYNLIDRVNNSIKNK